MPTVKRLGSVTMRPLSPPWKSPLQCPTPHWRAKPKRRTRLAGLARLHSQITDRFLLRNR